MTKEMNLDLESARYAQEIVLETKQNEVKDVENLVTKTLGVLQENGVYSCMLFLYSRTSDSDKKVSKCIREKLLEMTKLLGKTPVKDKSDDVLKFITENICNDIDTLLLTKQLWEQTLTYARYGAKARAE